MKIATIQTSMLLDRGHYECRQCSQSIQDNDTPPFPPGLFQAAYLRIFSRVPRAFASNSELSITTI